MASTTLSIRVTDETRGWLERFAMQRGSAGGAAARLLDEARRREEFPAVDFRDTPLGRVAYIHGTRIQMALARRQAIEWKFRPEKLARHYGWPLWKAESAVAYIKEFDAELARDEATLLERSDALHKRLPRLETFSA